jgi:CheY-like chemotaxis protein
METKMSSLLIVDDEIMVIRALLRCLDSSAYSIYHTVEASQALEILKSTRWM